MKITVFKVEVKSIVHNTEIFEVYAPDEESAMAIAECRFKECSDESEHFKEALIIKPA